MIVSLNLVQTKKFAPGVICPKKSLRQDVANTLNMPGKPAVNAGNVAFFGRKLNSTKNDPLSFEEFNKRRIAAGILGEEDLEGEICAENLIGTGANSNVYKFSDPKLKGWVLKVDKKPTTPAKKGFQRADNIFGGENMGQEIASIGTQYHILKKIEGTPHSLKDWSFHINNDSKISKKEAGEFLESIETISNFPDDSFDDYANTLKTLSDKGFKMDSINPNNLLVDYDNKTIHIIDFFKAVDPSHVNSAIDLSACLLDFSMFKYIYEKLDDSDKIRLLDAANTIITKCNTASAKAGLPQDEDTYLKYIQNVDKWFGFALKDKGGTYRERYETMKELLPDIAP